MAGLQLLRLPEAQPQEVGQRALLLTLGVLVLIWTVAATRWIVTDTVVPWDSKNQFYAFFRFLAATVHTGHAPFWNPYHYGGHPSVADPQSLIFSPPFVLWAFFDPAPSIHVFDFIVYAHLGVGALAIGAIGWRNGWPLPASILAAVIFMFGGPASGRLQHSGMIMAYGLFPVALLTMQVALQRRSKAVAAVFGAVAAMLALGRNQLAMLLCMVFAAVVASEIAKVGDRLRYLRARAGVLMIMAVVGLALLAVPFLLTLQFAMLSNRPEVPLRVALEGSLHPSNLATVAVANIMGSLERSIGYWGPSTDTLAEVASTDRSTNYLFIGSASTIVVLWLGVAAGGMFRPQNRLMTTVLIAALVYALGRYTPLYELAFNYVPGVRMFRHPTDSTFLLVAALAILSGQLLADYVREGLPTVSRAGSGLVVVGALSIIASAVLFSVKSRRELQSLFEVLKVLPVVMFVVVILARAHGARKRVVAAGVVALIATTELLWCNTASSLNAERSSSYAILQKPNGPDEPALGVLEREVERRHRNGEWPRVEIVGVGGPWQNVAMTRGLEATNGYNPLRIGSYDRLVSPGETTHVVEQRMFPASFDGYDCTLARELGLEYLVLGRPIEQIPRLRRRPIADVLVAGPRIWIYRLRRAEPRVRVIKRAMVLDTDPQIRAGRFSIPAEAAAIDDSTAPKHPIGAATHIKVGSALGEAHIRSWTPGRVEIQVNTDQPGIVMLHETYYPGWVAEIDGRPSPILRANILFRAVEVSEGRHTIVFRFAPFSVENLSQALWGVFGRRTR